MHSRSTTIIGAGVIVALLGGLLVLIYARNLRGSAGATSAPTELAYVATAPISAGASASTLTTSVKQTGVPIPAVPADAIGSLSQISGLVALQKIEPGEVVTKSQFGTAGTPSTNTSGLSIPAGQNAVTVNVPIPQNVAGYVSPGDQVNLYMTSKDIGGGNAARLLLSDVTVLSTVVEGTPTVTTPAPAAGSAYFTLALSPADSEKVIYAETFEQVWFALVHPGDPAATTGGQLGTTLFK
jgi:pilus assembly protein CpaB